jgi:hypothetical protein
MWVCASNDVVEAVHPLRLVQCGRKLPDHAPDTGEIEVRTM